MPLNQLTKIIIQSTNRFIIRVLNLIAPSNVSFLCFANFNQFIRSLFLVKNFATCFVLAFGLLCFSSINFNIQAQSYYPVKINQQWGLMDSTGQLVISPQYEVIGAPEKFGYILMQQAGKIGMLDRKGKILIPAKYEEVKILGQHFISVKEAGIQKVINAVGQLVLQDPNYEQLSVLHPQFLTFSQNGRFGCINAVGQLIIPPKYESIKIHKDNYFKVQNGRHHGLLHLNGEEIVPAHSEEIRVLDNGLIFYLKGVLWGAFDQKGQSVIQAKFSAYQAINSALIKLERFGAFHLFNVLENKIVSKQTMQDFLSFSDQYALTRRGEKFGLIDYQGKQILANQYQEIQSFSDVAFRVRNGWKWGVINNAEQQLLAYEYDFIAPIRKGKALVKKGNFFGIIDANGAIIVPAEYSKINVSGENIKAFKGEKWTLYYIDENGNPLKGPKFNKHFKIQVQGNNEAAELRRLNRDGFDNSYLLDDFEWFYDSNQRKWGLRRLSDGQNEIEPTFNTIQIERDLGFTIVGIEKQGGYRFDRTNYRFNNLYGIVNNKVGKLVTHLVLWDVRTSDFRNGSLVARVVFNNGRHGLMLRNGKFVKKDFGYIGEFKDGLAKISISGKISAKLKTTNTSLGTLPEYLDGLIVGSDMTDFTIHDQQFEEEAYLTCEDCSWGFIDTTAFISIQPKYEVAHNYINDVCIVQEKEKWGMIDRLGNNLLPKKYDGVQFLEGTDNQIIKLSENSPKYGLMDTLGQLLVDLAYEDIGQFRENRLAVKKGNRWGFVAPNGKEIISPKYQKIGPFSEGLAAVRFQRKWIFIDPAGNTVLADNYRDAGNFVQGLAWVKTDQGVGFIGPDGATQIPFEFSQAFDFKNGIARVVKEGKYGLIDPQGNFILKPKFSHIAPFDENGMAIVRYGNRVTNYGIIDQTGQMITQQNYRKIYPFQEGRALVKHKSGYGFIDRNGQLVIEGNYSKAANFSEGRAMVQRNNRCGYINLAGREIIPLTYSKCLDFEGGKAVVYEGLKKGGIIDLAGEEIIAPGINRLIDFKEGRGLVRKDYQFYYIDESANWRDGYFERAERYQHGVAVVRKNGKWGIINRNGLNVITHKYDSIEDFEKGFAKVQLKQFVGLADLSGQLIIPPEYEYISYAGGGLFRVENGGKIGYLRKDGVWVWDLQE